MTKPTPIYSIPVPEDPDRYQLVYDLNAAFTKVDSVMNVVRAQASSEAYGYMYEQIDQAIGNASAPDEITKDEQERVIFRWNDTTVVGPALVRGPIGPRSVPDEITKDSQERVLFRWEDQTVVGPQLVRGPAGVVDDASLSAALAPSGTASRAALTSILNSAVSTSGTNELTSTRRVKISEKDTYDAFPCLERLPDGRILALWRRGYNHVDARDGYLVQSYSSDNGLTWTAPTVAVDDSRDLRDPAVLVDGNRIYLTYFVGSAANAAMGCYLRVSTDGGKTWGTESRIDNGHEYAAICAPLVKTGGKLFAFWYGKYRVANESRDSIWYSYSSDNGATWSNASQVINGNGDARDYQEPWAVPNGDGSIQVYYRYGGGDGIGSSVSNAAGIAWTARGKLFTASGRPTVRRVGKDLVLTHRGTAFGSSGVMHRSTDNGQTWGPAVSLGSGKWMYSDLVQVGPGAALMFTAQESATTLATMYAQYVGAGSDSTPAGLTVPTGHEVRDDFNRADGPLGDTLTNQAWTSTGGQAVISGALQNTDSNLNLATVPVSSSNYAIEAEMSWAGQSGGGIVFAYVDASNYALATFEGGGAAAKIYEIKGGIPGDPLYSVTLPFPSGPYAKLTVVKTGGIVRFGIDGEHIMRVGLSVNTGATRVGVKTNGANAATQRFRSFKVTTR